MASKSAKHFAPALVASLGKVAPDIVRREVREKHAPRAKGPGLARYEHAADAALHSHVGGVKRPRASECAKGKFSDLVTLFDRYRADGPAHIRVCDLKDAMRSLLEGKAKRFCDEIRNRSACRFEITLHPATEHHRRIEAAEANVGVRDRRFVPALAVSDGARRRTCRARTDFQRTRIVNGGNRSRRPPR